MSLSQKAKTAISENNYKERATNIDGARKIIRELMRTIDLENGNDVSKQLFKLYNKMAMNLIKANVQRNSEKVEEVIEDLTNIRWGFQKAIEIQSGVTTLEEVMKEQQSMELQSAGQFSMESVEPETVPPQTEGESNAG